MDLILTAVVDIVITALCKFGDPNTSLGSLHADHSRLSTVIYYLKSIQRSEYEATNSFINKVLITTVESNALTAAVCHPGVL